MLPPSAAAADLVACRGDLSAVLHAENGDGVFDPATDQRLIGPDGDDVDDDFDYRLR